MSWNTKHLICFRLASNPVDDVGLLSFTTFSWLTPVMVRAYKHMLTVDTLPPLPPYDSSDVNAKRYRGLPGSLWEGGPPWERACETLCVVACPHVEMDICGSQWPFAVASPWHGLGWLKFLAQYLERGGTGESWWGERTAWELLAWGLGPFWPHCWLFGRNAMSEQW